MFRKELLVIAVLTLTLPSAGREKTRQEQISALFALIDRADQMVVYSEGFKREFVIYRSSNRKDFEDLKAAITLKPNEGPFVCACVDGPEIAFLKNNKEIAAVWNHEGTAIGSSVWEGDWQTSDPDRWLRWFDVRGMSYARELSEQARSASKKADDDEHRWLKAMPSSLKPLWSKAQAEYDPPKFPDLKPLDATLKAQYPDMHDRIRALLAWFGSGAGPWSGFPGYEEIAAKLLREYSTPDLIAAVQNRKLSDEEVEGAARILGSRTPVSDKTPIPPELRRVLLDHCLKSSDQDKVARAQEAFAPEK
jgi:hypothetical protein